MYLYLNIYASCFEKFSVTFSHLPIHQAHLKTRRGRRTMLLRSRVLWRCQRNSQVRLQLRLLRLQRFLLLLERRRRKKRYVCMYLDFYKAHFRDPSIERYLDHACSNSMHVYLYMYASKYLIYRVF